YFDHIRQHTVRSPPQLVHPFYRQQVRADSGYLGPHTVQHFTQLLQIRLAGRVIDGRGPLSQDSCHHYIRCSCNGSLVQQYIGALKLRSVDVKKMIIGIIYKLSTQLFEPEKMRIQTPATDLIASRFWNRGLTETGQQ